MNRIAVDTSLIVGAVLMIGCASGGGMGTSTTGTTAGGTTATTTGGTTTTTSGGEVDVGGGAWNDGMRDGMWMDTTGAMRMGGRRGRMMGLQAADIRGMSDANIVAHLAAGDSLEVQLSTTALSRAQNQSVRDFVQRMVTEHTQHMQQGRQLAMQNGITPTPAPGDTIDAMMTTRMMSRLTNGGMAGMSMSNGTSGTSTGDTDRQIMGAEVAMHRHMLHELTLMQPQATGAARTLVDQTIPIVRQHLTDAESIWRQVGGGTGRNGNGTQR
jgi:predicted outer membrane protein